MSTDLCYRCRAIPLDPGLQTLSNDEYQGPTSWPLGTFGEVRRRRCPFCELVVSISAKIHSSWEAPRPPNDATVIHLEYSKNGFTTLHSSIGSSICVAGKTPQCSAACAKAELTEWVDFEDVRRWISTCVREHAAELGCPVATFNPRVLPRNSKRQLDFRLIDTEEMCIVYAPPECRYVALSYVWGRRRNQKRQVLTSDNEERLMESQALTCSEIQASIPQTIRDAMSVVRKLGERYLWVDSLCLLQDDEDEMKECIAVMDLFYEMALLTIVAATGDAWSGLPGVAPTSRRCGRFVRSVMPGLTMTTVSDVDVPLRQSLYSSRAWTMQEEVLSTRLLVFIDNQIYFQCGKGLVNEAQNWPGQKPRTTSYSASLYNMILRVDASDYLDFGTLVSYYMSRQLTFQDDVLRGAQGMLRKFSLLYGVHCFEGIPAPLDHFLLFEVLPPPASRAYGRRAGFPSYSWTGWVSSPMYRSGTITNDMPGDKFQMERRDRLRRWITWYCKLEDGRFRRIDATGRLRKAPIPRPEDALPKSPSSLREVPVSVSDINFGSVKAQKYPLLLFWTVCVNLRVKISKSGSEERKSQFLPQCTPLDRDGNQCGFVELDSQPSEGTEAKFAILAESNQEYMALMLVWKDEIAERRGLARLSLNVMTTCLPPGPRWKPIVLG